MNEQLLFLFNQLEESQKQSLLHIMESMMDKNFGSAANISIEAYNKELEDALKSVQNGAYTTITDLEKEMQQW